MKLLSERTYHALFWIGMVSKVVISAAEIMLGVLFYYFNYATLAQWAIFFTGDELTEVPRDAFWNLIAHAFNGFFSTPQSVWVFIFLSHGIIKTALAVGIIRNIRWVYPVGAITFALFVIYQCYQFIYAPSFALVAISLFDIAVIGLILHEYYHNSVIS